MAMRPFKKKHALVKKHTYTRPAAPDPLEHHPFMPYITGYLEWLSAAGFRPQGVEVKAKGVRRFALWCSERGIERPQEITLPILERYQRHLFHYRKKDGAPLAFTGQLILLVPLKGFFRWMTRSRHLLTNPASELMLPRKPVHLPPRVLTMAEIEDVLRLCEVTYGDGHVGGVRDRAIIETLYSTAVRRGELAGFKVWDWDRSRGVMAVREGKGGKDRVVPIGDRASAWLARYVDEVRPVLVIEPDDGTLFLADYGEPLGKNRLGDLVRRYLDLAGVEQGGSCHLFRHACATHMLENGADIRYIQVLLGHADLSTTELYTRVSILKLKEIHAATHPARLSRPTQPRQSAATNADDLTPQPDPARVLEAILAIDGEE